MTIFEFVGTVVVQNGVFKVQEVFSEHMGSEYSKRKTWKFPDITYFKGLRRTRGAKKIPKTQFRKLD
jgi:hypothetical protein